MKYAAKDLRVLAVTRRGYTNRLVDLGKPEYRQRSSGRLRPVGGERRGGEVVSYYTPLVTTTETSGVTLLPRGHRDSA